MSIQHSSPSWTGDWAVPASFGGDHACPPSLPPRPSPSRYRRWNPASIATDNAAAIRASGLKIFFDCGDNDYLNLHDGAEFLHRVLWDHGIQHEYRLVHGADHLGQPDPPPSWAVVV